VLVPVMLGGGKVEAEERAKLNVHVPTYSNPTRGVRAIAALVRRASLKHNA